MAMACALGLPALISVAMFLEIDFFEYPWIKGIELSLI